VRVVEDKSELLLLASSPVVTITANSSVYDAMRIMVSKGFRRLPVVDPETGVLVGIITATDILDFLTGGPRSRLLTEKYGGDLSKALGAPVSDIMVRDVVSVRVGEGLKTAVRTMVEKHVGGLPIVDEKGRAWAILTERDIVRSLAGRPSGYKVSELMSPDPVVAEPDETVAEAVRKVLSKGFRRLPLVGPKGELLGIITTMDILRHLVKAVEERRFGPEVLTAKLSDVATKEVITIGPDEDVGRAAELMWEHGIGALPVVEPGTGRLVGIITERDFFKLLR